MTNNNETTFSYEAIYDKVIAYEGKLKPIIVAFYLKQSNILQSESYSEISEADNFISVNQLDAYVLCQIKDNVPVYKTSQFKFSGET